MTKKPQKIKKPPKIFKTNINKNDNKKKSDIKISSCQMKALKEIFSKYNDLTDQQYNALAQVINLKASVIRDWYKNTKNKVVLSDITNTNRPASVSIRNQQPILKECRIEIERLNPRLYSSNLIKHTIASLPPPNLSNNNTNDSVFEFHFKNSVFKINPELIASAIAAGKETVIKYDRNIDDEIEDGFENDIF
jgi:hypothetical protein